MMLFTLSKPLYEVQKAILNQVKIGQAIRSQRIQYIEDLEEARREKQEWVSRTTELLKQLFPDPAVADECNDWVGPILPEYAEWALFVEQFDKEMKHRLGRLQELLARLAQLEPPAPPPEPAAPTPPPVTEEKAPPPIERPAQTVVLNLPRDIRSREAIKEFLQSLLNCLESESPVILRSDRIPADS
jgi:hypothetical protein